MDARAGGDGVMLRGVDISSVQGSLPWPTLIAQHQIAFAFVKAAESTFKDGRFDQHVAEATTHGIVVGPYLVPHAVGDPVEQAKRHFDLAGGLGSQPGSLPPALDLELPKIPTPDLRPWYRDYALAAADAWGCRPVLYTFPWWWEQLGGAEEPSFAKACDLWIANYPSSHAWPAEGAAPLILKPWTSWLFWQFSSATTLPGLDADLFNGDADALHALTST